MISPLAAPFPYIALSCCPCADAGRHASESDANMNPFLKCCGNATGPLKVPFHALESLLQNVGMLHSYCALWVLPQLILECGVLCRRIRCLMLFLETCAHPSSWPPPQQFLRCMACNPSSDVFWSGQVDSCISIICYNEGYRSISDGILLII